MLCRYSIFLDDLGERRADKPRWYSEDSDAEDTEDEGYRLACYGDRRHFYKAHRVPKYLAKAHSVVY